MTITAHPTVGFQNLLRKVGSVLTSADDDLSYPIANIASGNLGVVAALTGTTTNSFTFDQGPVNLLDVSAVFLRFRENWEDIDSIQIEADDEPTFTSPPFDETYTNLFPDTYDWDIGVPRRPIFRAVFDAVTYQYWRITITRTAGTNPVSIAACYIGPATQLSHWVDGIAVFGQSVSVDAATDEMTADVDTDFRFLRSPRRSTQIKLMAISSVSARSLWLRKLMFASRNADIFYSFNPLETDPMTIHNETLWGPGMLDSLTFASVGDWEGTLTIKERL